MEPDRLSRELVEKLESARMMAEALSLGAQLARDTVGRWIRGTTVPTPSSLQAVEEVLGARLGFAIDLSAAVSERRSTQQRNRQPADEEQGRTAARADWSEMASEGISMLEVKPSAPDAERSSRDRRTRTTLGESLRQTGLLNVFASWEDATAEMSAAVADPQTIEIRLLGLDLTNWFAGRRSGGTESPGRLLERLLRAMRPAQATSRYSRASALARSTMYRPGCSPARPVKTKVRSGSNSSQRDAPHRRAPVPAERGTRRPTERKFSPGTFQSRVSRFLRLHG